MATPYLIADSAQVTVLRSLASTAFGKYSLALPEGVDLEDVYEVSAPGNELAYVSSLGSKRRVGGMFRRFVRADVSVTAQGEDVVPASDVERVLDEAAKRVSGDFFLESDISKAGLGPWVPMVDFHVGDIANVEIWGRVVPLVVTRIEPKSTDHSDNDWSVHVGGQLLSDSEARLAENADIYNAVVSDRRELAGLDGKIRAETSNRKSAVAAESRARTEAISAEAQARALADSEEARARQKAISDLSESFSTELETYGRLVEEAKNSVDPATRQVVDFWSEENQNNFNKAVQLTLSAQSAYNDINNIKWVSQDAWNAQQEKINEARDKFEAQQIEIDAAQDEVAKANQKAADAAKQAADTAQDLATENGVLLAKIDSLQGELDKRSVGKVTLLGGQRRKSSVHGIGIRAPYNDRDLVVVTSKEFVGSITVQIFYKNGAAYQRVYYSDSGITQLYRRVVEEDPFFEEFRYKKAALYNAYWEVPLGSIDTITVLVDHLPWQWS